MSGLNAIAPPPKRPHGTGTVGQQTNGKWRYRLPGGRFECGGFTTREEAVAALEEHRNGRPGVIGEIERLVVRIDRLAERLGVTFQQALEETQTARLIAWSRRRRMSDRQRGAR